MTLSLVRYVTTMTFRAYLVELVGTFLLVFLCAGAVCVWHPRARDGSVDGILALALAQGAAYAVLLMVTTRLSQGCLNPAVVLAQWVTRRFDFGRAIALILVQLIGAILAGGFLVLLFEQGTMQDAFAGTPHLRSFLDAPEKFTVGDWVVGTLIELILTFFLTLALLVAVLDPTRVSWGVLFAGLALTAAVLVGYHATGASLNPARYLGSAVWQAKVLTPQEVKEVSLWKDHLPYWMGPIVGALLAGLAHAEWLKPAEKKG